MAVNPTTLGYYTPYVLNTHYTQAEFDQFAIDAREQFAVDNPGLSLALADKAQCLLIAHYISVKPKGGNDLQSESIQGYGYVRITTTATNELSWMGQYKALIASFSTQPNRGVERYDIDPPAGFKMSPQTLPKFG
jgi:hypothetical protein